MFPAGPETDALKRRFAEAFARNPQDAFAAARTIEPNVIRAQYIASYWVNDPVVSDHIDALSAKHGPAALLPTKDEFALKIMGLADEIPNKDLKLDYLKLAAELMGFLPKNGGTTINNNVAVVNKVMKVPAFANREDAKRTIAAQQARLINASAG